MAPSPIVSITSTVTSIVPVPPDGTNNVFGVTSIETISKSTTFRTTGRTVIVVEELSDAPLLSVTVRVKLDSSSIRQVTVGFTTFGSKNEQLAELFVIVHS